MVDKAEHEGNGVADKVDWETLRASKPEYAGETNFEGIINYQLAMKSCKKHDFGW